MKPGQTMRVKLKDLKAYKEVPKGHKGGGWDEVVRGYAIHLLRWGSFGPLKYALSNTNPEVFGCLGLDDHFTTEWVWVWAVEAHCFSQHFFAAIFGGLT